VRIVLDAGRATGLPNGCNDTRAVQRPARPDRERLGTGTLAEAADHDRPGWFTKRAQPSAASIAPSSDVIEYAFPLGELKEEAYYRLETAYGTFERFIPLPEGFEEGEIEAAYEDGVLEVIVPAAAKALEAPKPRTIPIKTALPIKVAKVA